MSDYYEDPLTGPAIKESYYTINNMSSIRVIRAHAQNWAA